MIRQWGALALPVSLLIAAPAAAQVEESLIVQPAIPQDFGRGRNVSVQQMPRPDYDPLGVLIGSMKLLPSADVGSGATTNTYYTSRNNIATPYLYQQLSAQLVSGWSRHSLQISGSTTQREYIGQSERNEDLWTLDATGRLDVYSTIKIDADLNASRSFENLFSGEVSPTLAALSRFRRNFASLRATYTMGRIRTFVLLDHASFDFSPVPRLGGGVVDQGERNRQVTRLTGQLEYARTPSIALFAQISGSDTNYDQLLSSGLPNVSSKAIRFLSGVNFDIAGRVRGTVGVGYSVRNYDAAIYKTVRGLSIETQLEAFPAYRLTIGLTWQRTIEDATEGEYNPYWSTRYTLRTDYELLRNLILTGSATYSHLSYTNIHGVDQIYGGSTTARFIASRRVVIRGALSYSRRQSTSVNEGRIETAITYRL